ncbi:urease subunit beta [Chondromyces crocatus]|uniref:Urease subunit beta n=1 Tax=Chondromyces crocatus TaxID=52 RepID=A0A0K1ED87_CHOCO|nr:urease subunit beta [Chondromyces crocatus]AKT38642.1 urease subunit beta [Chondromyces crocatus]
MHLSPREIDKLTLHNAGFLAQKRLARGVRLNVPESIALLSTQILELIRDGKRVAELMDLGKRILGRNQVMEGVPEIVTEVQIEGTFPDGTKLVTVHHPIAAEQGDLALALYGSFLPVPDLARFPSLPLSRELTSPPGAYQVPEGDIVLNEGRSVVQLRVANLADRPIQVGSHYHFIEANPYLRFDRARAYGHRLDIPAGAAVRFEPGEVKTVTLVPIAGERVIRGGNNLAQGPVCPENLARAMERVQALGFAHEPEA